MSKYQKLYSLSENLYAEGAPLIIAAGALQKDTETGSVFAQLKFRNIDNRTIKAVRVVISAFDDFGKELGEKEFLYQDISARRDDKFGQKMPVVLDNATRSFVAKVAEVAFADGSKWNESGAEWKPIEKQQPISCLLKEHELIKQYHIKYGNSCDYLAKTDRDLVLCSCGTVNKAGENLCYNCRNNLSALLSLDIVALTAEKDARLAKEAKAAEEKRIAEAKAAEERRIAAEKAKKKAKKAFAIGTPIVCACIAFLIVLTTVIIPNNKYNVAVSLLNDGKIIEAYDSLIALNGYKDSTTKASEIFDQYKIEKLKEKIKIAEVGDTVYFGAYEQDNNTSNGKEDIEWIVLAKENGKALVISKYALDYQQYNSTYTDVTWEKCSLRTWMNGTFLNNAFSTDEQAKIATTTVSADKNPEYSTNPENATTDKVFLLSINEAEKYFTNDETRKCAPTAYAIAQGARTNDYYKTSSGEATCLWWLRSSGGLQDYAADVSYGGSVVLYAGYSAYYGGGCVRPALWISIEP